MSWDRALAAAIDHTVLGADASDRDIELACDEAILYGFSSLVVHPFYLPTIVDRLHGTSVSPCSVVSFPFGAHMPLVKREEARRLIGAGAVEIDAVMNIAAFRSGHREFIEEEAKGLASVCQGAAVFKLIIETAYLDDRQIADAAQLAMEFGADFVKTSTGFASRGVTVRDIEVIKSVVGDRMGIKASGGIKTQPFARELLDAGATRLGCSSSLGVIGA